MNVSDCKDRSSGTSLTDKNDTEKNCKDSSTDTNVHEADANRDLGFIKKNKRENTEIAGTKGVRTKYKVQSESPINMYDCKISCSDKKLTDVRDTDQNSRYDSIDINVHNEDINSDFVDGKIERSEDAEIEGHIGINNEEAAKLTLQEIEKELKIVLIGATGSGKSSTGNTILGRTVFEYKESASSVTFETRMGKAKINNRTVCVVDTPGVFDTKNCIELVQEEIAKCITFTIPGPHAIVLVVKIGRYTEESRNAIKHFASHFGDDLFKYVILLFTNTDQLERESFSLNQFITGSTDLLDLVKKCGGRYVGFNNIANDRSKKQQVLKLLKEIDLLLVKNDCAYYTNDMYNKAKEVILTEIKNEATELQRKYNLEIKQIEDELNVIFNKELQIVDDKIKSLTWAFDKERQKNIDKEYRSRNINRQEEFQRRKEKVTDKFHKDLKKVTANVQKNPSVFRQILAVGKTFFNLFKSQSASSNASDHNTFV